MPVRRLDVPTQPQVASSPVETSHPGVKSGELEHNESLEYDPKKSGATKEAAASKSAEHQFAGRAQEARLRDFQNPTVLVNGKPAEPVLTYDKHAPPMYKSTQESQSVLVNSKKPVRPSDLDNCDNSKEPIK